MMKQSANHVNGFILPVISVILLHCLSFPVYTQTAGKLAGVVTDTHGNPLVGVNVILVGTAMGSATDADGTYIILNVRAGVYSLRFEYLGYKTHVVRNVQVSADKTTRVNAELEEETIPGEVVTVTAQKKLIEFNQTSSISTVNKNDIRQLPVQSLKEIVNLQAGVIDGHFRGGRLGEVQFQVDGVTVNNPFDNSSTLRLDRSVLEEVQVISGTFDAKYGQAMSGVVNAVLKTGTGKFEISGESYFGDYFTPDKNRYPHNQGSDLSPGNIESYQLTLSGPVPVPHTTFFLSGRRFIDNGWLFGERRFLSTDSSNFENRNFNPTGDNKIVPMAWRKEWSGQFKLTNRSLSSIQLSYQLIFNHLKQQRYNHAFRLNPEGIPTQTTLSITHGLEWTHTLSERMFYKFSIRQNYFDYRDYVYESVYDPRYIEAGPPVGDPNFEDGAVVQGVDLGRFVQRTNAAITKGDWTWQYNRTNLIEAGIEGQFSELSFGSPGYLRPTTVNGVEVLQPRESLPGEPGVKTYYPRQMASYLQDRIEWGDLVVRAGVRFEYFDANATVPSDLRNPANAISGAPKSFPKKTSVKTAIAPRLGFSFPLTSSASIYFSYGHFYQMPGLGLLYNNADYSILKEIQEGSLNFGIVMGNPDLKPEFTVQYEMGLKQALTSFLALEVTTFYKDIRDLLGVEYITTYNVSQYGHFANVDFGNVYGVTLSLDQRPVGRISTSIDYTLQVARGNASEPRETANRAQAGKDPRPRDIPFNWDQRHTINATVIYSRPKHYSMSAIIRLGSGQPYTPQIGSGFGADLETNSGRKSSFLTVDVRAEKFFTIAKTTLSAYFRVFNLTNAHFVNGFVFPTTGSPDYSQFPAVDKVTLGDPSRFHEPRRIELGLSFYR